MPELTSKRAAWAAKKLKSHYNRLMTQGLEVKLIRENTDPSQVFWTFFLLGPALAASLQLLLLNLGLLIVFLRSLDGLLQHGWSGPLLLLGAVEISGVIGAMLVFIFGLPASLLIALCAMLSYLTLRRVNLVVVLAAVFAAIWLEDKLAPDFYTGYLASHGVSGPWPPNDAGTHPWQGLFLVWLLHLIPASICLWLVRRKRLPPVWT